MSDNSIRIMLRDIGIVAGVVAAFLSAVLLVKSTTTVMGNPTMLTEEEAVSLLRDELGESIALDVATSIEKRDYRVDFDWFLNSDSSRVTVRYAIRTPNTIEDDGNVVVATLNDQILTVTYSYISGKWVVLKYTLDYVEIEDQADVRMITVYDIEREILREYDHEITSAVMEQVYRFAYEIRPSVFNSKSCEVVVYNIEPDWTDTGFVFEYNRLWDEWLLVEASDFIT